MAILLVRIMAGLILFVAGAGKVMGSIFVNDTFSCHYFIGTNGL